MKLTYKKDKRATGLMGVVFPWPQTNIKAEKKKIGYIARASDGWKINLAVKKEKTVEDPAPFKWISFKVRFASEPEAREWLDHHIVSIAARYNLHRFED